MTPATLALLADRAVVRVAGEDAVSLLQGIITNDMDLLARLPAIHAGLLTPQGKILFEFFVIKNGDGFLLETARASAADLVKRLGLYKLRAKVVFEDMSGDFRVLAAWGSPLPPVGVGDWGVCFPDPRFAQLGARLLLRIGQPDPSPTPALAAPEHWHAERIGLGVPEGGKDYTLGEAFPHEADFDLLNGVSFTKGCFVGQEVVSRMQNRASVRKRIVQVRGEAPLVAGQDIAAGAAVIGTVGSVAGREALALVRLDRAAEAAAKGLRLVAGGVVITLHKPDWASFELAPAVAAGAS